MLPHDFTCDDCSYRLERAPRAPRSSDNRGFELVPEREREALVLQWAVGHERLVAELLELACDRELPTALGDADASSARLLESLCGPGATLVLLRRMPLPIEHDPAPTAEDAEPLVTDDVDDDTVDQANHWIELAFVDVDGVPMTGIACVVELPSGQLQSARSNDAGMVRVEDIPRAGRCIVTFDGPAAAGLATRRPRSPRSS